MEQASDQPSTDSAALERLKRFGGGKLLGDMISLFVSTTPGRMAAAHAGYEAKNAKEVEMALHSLKSSSAQLGAMLMQRICERGENIAKTNSLESIGDLMMQLDDEFPRVKDWLERARVTETT